MKITSNAFQNGEFIPAKYTCDGEDISPDLKWIDIPKESQSLVLICDDPDAPMGTWIHWLIYNIPPSIERFEENISALPDDTKLGLNSWSKASYGGPCPPTGTHRYMFKLYALDTKLDLSGNITSKTLEKAMQGHILAEAKLMGQYKRGG